MNNGNFSGDVAEWLRVSCMNIVVCLVFPSSCITQEEMRAQKSLQPYEHIVDGMVQEVLSVTVSGRTLLRGDFFFFPIIVIYNY